MVICWTFSCLLLALQQQIVGDFLLKLPLHGIEAAYLRPPPPPLHQTLLFRSNTMCFHFGGLFYRIKSLKLEIKPGRQCHQTPCKVFCNLIPIHYNINYISYVESLPKFKDNLYILMLNNCDQHNWSQLCVVLQCLKPSIIIRYWLHWSKNRTWVKKTQESSMFYNIQPQPLCRTNRQRTSRMHP